MQHIPKLTTATELNYNLLADKANELIDKVAFYKSIVKAVDPDNLPDAEVLCIGDFNRLLFGQIDYCKVGEELFVFKNDDVLSNPTHYIETKNIIKMMGDL